MANEQNLNYPPIRTAEEAERKGKAGGIASGKARLAKKRGRELMQAMLAMKELDPRVLQELAATWGVDPKALTKEFAVNARQVDKAIRKADTAAFTAVHRVAGTLEPEGATGNTLNVNITQETAAALGKWASKK